MADYDFTYTGAEIQAILDTGKKLKDSGYIFLGVATPSTNPGTPTQKVYYEAKQAGTYTNFGGVVLPDGISLLKWDGSWTSETLMCGDGGVFDISVYKSSGGTLATFADLSAALDGGNNIPASARKGGMSVKFVQSSDNKYVQYRLMADEFTTDTTQWAIAEEGVYVENPEFVYVKTDRDGKILWAIKIDGSIYYGAGVPQQVIDYINEKIAELSLDEYEDIVAFLNGLEEGDKTLQTLLNEKVDKEEGKSLIDAEYASTKSTIDSQEFIEAKTDSEGKLLAGRTPDGAAFENIGFSTPKVSIAGHAIENIEDPEGRTEITTDAEGKILSYRDADGVKHENVGIEAPVVESSLVNSKETRTEKITGLTDEGISEFEEMLKSHGFNPGVGGDYSDVITKKGKNPVYIPTPSCATLNIISDVDLTELSKSDQPDGVQKVNYDVKVQIEFFDGQGIYFKKWALIGAQGNSSMAFVKKNISVKIFDTEDVEGKKKKWGKGDTFGTVFGDWVMQTSYHLKAYYTDYIHGSGVIGYQISDEVYKTRGVYSDRPWKKALVDFDSINSYTPAGLSANGESDVNLQIDNGARCMPDGFPVIVFQNGEFYGIFSWQLKKDAANYHLDESNPQHIHLDGDLTYANIWGGNIDWTKFEIRCPEDLVDMNGDDYDGDFPTELIDSSSPNYDSTNEDHVKSAQVKQYIIDLSTRMGEISSQSDGDVRKTLFNTYFDKDNLIDYELINMALRDGDAFGKNWQWVTYDGVKWWCNQYDKDQCFGNYFTGMATVKPSRGFFQGTPSSRIPTDFAILLYTSDIKQRWNELVNVGIFTPNHFQELISKWVKRIGKTYFEKEWEKWSEAPCNRNPKIDYDNWVFDNTYSSGMSLSIPTGGVVWNNSDTYNTDDIVWFKDPYGDFYLSFKAKKQSTNKSPIIEYYTEYPRTLGYRDSVWRYYKFIEEQLENQNNYINNL